MELTLNKLRSEGKIDDQDFLDRADVLGSMGYIVMISNYQRYFKLVEYFAKVTREKIGITLGMLNLENIFEESYYDYLPGGILESFSTLFSKDVKLYAYPSKSPVSNILYDLHSFNVEDHLVHLYQHLIVNNKIEAIEDFTEAYLAVQSEEALESIQMGDDRWQQMVPKEVVRIVKEKRLFGYQQG